MKSLLKHVPNTITLLNLVSGCVAISSAIYGKYQLALLWVLAAAVFDFLDGFAARLLKAYSPLGKELDSLADLVSFGVAPGFVIFAFLFNNNVPNYFAAIAFSIPVFSALRLAKFNIDTRQTESFLGLPTPANAIFWVSFANLPFYLFFNQSQTIYIIFGLLAVTSFLMVSELPMFSLKFKNLTWKDNNIRFIFLGISISLLILFKINALAPIILVYILLSLLLFLVKKTV